MLNVLCGCALLCISIAAPVSRPIVERGALVIMNAEDKKEEKKKMPSPVKRALQSDERRLFNKGRKSACATRIKKVNSIGALYVRT